MSEKRGRILIEGGHVVTMDEELGELPGADVLIEDGTIAAVGPGLEAAGAERIDAAGRLVLPGLIDSHIHLWQTPLGGLAARCWAMEYFPAIHPFSAGFQAPDLYAATLGGAAQALRRGVTTVFDFCHTIHTPAHGDAAIDALAEAGVRAIFGYSLRHRPDAKGTSFASHEERIADAHRLAGSVAEHEQVEVAIALNNLEHVSPETNAAEIACARELGALATVHSIQPGQIADLAERELLGPDLQIVHATAASDAELGLLAEGGGSIAVTPEVEAGMMACVPVIGRALRAGVPVTLGVDVPSGVAIDMFAQMRAAYTIDRMLDALAQRRDGHPPVRSPLAPALDPARLLRMVTIEAAEALGLGERIGSLTPGKEADVLVLGTGAWGLGVAEPADFLASQAAAADVEAVFVGGRPRVLDGAPVGLDMDRIRGLNETARDRVVAARSA